MSSKLPSDQSQAPKLEATQISNAKTQEIYRYSPLGDNEIRLLEIRPGKARGKVIIGISHCPLSKPPKYGALSYVWGDPAPTRVVTCDRNQGHIWVAENCFAALLRLRDSTKPVTLWVDAICINQNDISERNSQVAIMANIYRQASRVIIFLGDEDNCSAIAMNCLAQAPPKNNWPLRTKCRAIANYDDPEVAALRAFFSRPWFSRIWVLQEVRNGNFPIIVCGPKTLYWRSFIYLVTYGFPEETLGPIPAALQMKDAIQTTKRTQERFIAERFFETLIRTRASRSSDPRDKIFALLPLFAKIDVGANEGMSGFMPDYSRSTRDTFVNLARYFLRSQHVGFRLLYAVEDGSSIPDLPSWVPDWSLAPKVPHLYSKSWLPRVVRNQQEISLIYHFGPHNFLPLPGRHFSTVTHVSTTCDTNAPSWTDTVFKEWRDLVVPAESRRTKPNSFHNPLETFYYFLGERYYNDNVNLWRAGNDPDFEQACKEPFKVAKSHTRQTVDEARAVHMRLRKCCHRQTFFLGNMDSSELRCCGITPSDIRLGDKLVYISGNGLEPQSTLAFILRQIEGPEQFHVLVGKCRVIDPLDSPWSFAGFMRFEPELFRIK